MTVSDIVLVGTSRESTRLWVHVAPQRGADFEQVNIGLVGAQFALPRVTVQRWLCKVSPLKIEKHSPQLNITECSGCVLWVWGVAAQINSETETEGTKLITQVSHGILSL